MVYLSKIDDLGVFAGCTAPLRSSPNPPESSLEAPQRMAKASRLRTLIARLLVRLKVLAIGGNTSFLTVLKSRTGRTAGRHLMAASTKEWVGESRPSRIRGRMSKLWCQLNGAGHCVIFTHHL